MSPQKFEFPENIPKAEVLRLLESSLAEFQGLCPFVGAEIYKLIFKLRSYIGADGVKPLEEAMRQLVWAMAQDTHSPETRLARWKFRECIRI